MTLEITTTAGKPEADTISNEMKREGQEVPNSTSEIHIDPVMERRIATKFDWLMLPQFVIIIILG